MKNLILTLATATLAVASGLPSAEAGHLEDTLTREAGRVKSAASALRSEFQNHFRHTPVFGQLTGDAQAIARRADVIQGMVYRVQGRPGLQRLESELRGLSQTVQHLGELVEGASRGCPRVAANVHRARSLVVQIKGSTYTMQGAVKAMGSRIFTPVTAVCASGVHGSPGHGPSGGDHGHRR